MLILQLLAQRVQGVVQPRPHRAARDPKATGDRRRRPAVVERLVWAAAGGLAAAAMGGYVLTRTIGGFLGDHSDVGNWRCPLGLAALSVETTIILLAAWQARRRTTAHPISMRPAARRAHEYSHPG